MCDAIEKQVTESQWIGGQQPSLADREAFEALSCPPNVESHPHAFAWWCLVAKFVPAVRQSWTGAAPAKAAPAKGAKKEAAPAKKADDDFDPFADDDDEEDAEAAKAALKKKAEEAKVKKEKAKPIAKSILVWEVKPYSADTDLDALAKKIISHEIDGLVWKTEYKKEPVAFGVFKLNIGAVIEDAKVSSDDVQEMMENLCGDEKLVKGEDDDSDFDERDYLVQSVEILVFNKL